jgi:hypothetical protein
MWDRVAKLVKIQFHWYVTPQISLLDKMQYIFDIEKRDDFWKISALKISNTTRRQIVPSYLRGYIYTCQSSHSDNTNTKRCCDVSLVIPQNWHLCRKVDMRSSRPTCQNTISLIRYLPNLPVRQELTSNWLWKTRWLKNIRAKDFECSASSNRSKLLAQQLSWVGVIL